MLKIWGRNNSSNVQKAMWAIGELGLPHERIDAGGLFGKTKEEPYISMNPNSLVPTLEEDGFILWESNSIIRYLAAKHGGPLAPTDPRRALASQWMDWQLSVLAPAITPAFLGTIRTPPEKRDQAAISASQAKTTEAAKILNRALGKTPTAGDAFSMGDIPVGVMIYRFWKLVPERPALPDLELVQGDRGAQGIPGSRLKLPLTEVIAGPHPLEPPVDGGGGGPRHPTQNSLQLAQADRRQDQQRRGGERAEAAAGVIHRRRYPAPCSALRFACAALRPDASTPTAPRPSKASARRR